MSVFITSNRVLPLIVLHLLNEFFLESLLIFPGYVHCLPTCSVLEIDCIFEHMSLLLVFDNFDRYEAIAVEVEALRNY